MEKQKISLTPDMLKGFKTLTCTCGGMLFQSGVVFKRISPLIAPSGKEEIYPLEVVVCKSCGKVPRAFNNPDVLPEEVLSEKVEVIEEPKVVTSAPRENTLKIVK